MVLKTFPGSPVRTKYCWGIKSETRTCFELPMLTKTIASLAHWLASSNQRGYWIAPLESDVSRTLQPRAWNYLHHTRQEDRDALSVHCIFSIRGSSAVQWGSAQQTIDIWHNIYFRSHLIKETIVQSFLISNPKTHRVL